MNTTPPADEPPWLAAPTSNNPNPARKISKPAVKSLCNLYTRLSTNVRSNSTIANTMATLAHFISEPKIIGIGPTIKTPPPLTCVPPFLASENIATTIIPTPTSTSANPARM